MSMVLLTLRSFLGSIERLRSPLLKSVAVWFSKNLGSSCFLEICPEFILIVLDDDAMVVVLLGVLLTTLLLVLSTAFSTSFIWY